MNTYRAIISLSCSKSGLKAFSEENPGCEALSATVVFKTVFTAENDEQAIEIVKKELEEDRDFENASWSVNLSRGAFVGGLFIHENTVFQSAG